MTPTLGQGANMAIENAASWALVRKFGQPYYCWGRVFRLFTDPKTVFNMHCIIRKYFEWQGEQVFWHIRVVGCIL